MCLLGFGFQIFPDCPIVLLANREEAYSRPTVGPRIERSSSGHPAWLGGIDRVAGGTWLGINAQGLIVAVTNREKREIPAEPRSRGLLCRALLAFESTASAVDAGVDQLKSPFFAGCNLLIADATRGVVIEADDDLKVTMLSPGLHLMTNAGLNDPLDRRIARVRAELSRSSIRTPADWISASRQVCAMTATLDQPAICLNGRDRGTVSSTIVALPNVHSDSEYWYAAGPPSTTSYSDESRQLQQLLGQLRGQLPGGGTGALASHTIQLRGPWRYRPISGVAQSQDGSPIWRTDDLPAPGIAQIPTTWKDLFGDFRGRVAFLRRFHSPDNLDPSEAVLLGLTGLANAAAVSLNGRDLGTIDPQTESWSYDVTALLRRSNEIGIELSLDSPLETAALAQLWRSVTLEFIPRR